MFTQFSHKDMKEQTCCTTVQQHARMLKVLPAGKFQIFPLQSFYNYTDNNKNNKKKNNNKNNNKNNKNIVCRLSRKQKKSATLMKETVKKNEPLYNDSMMQLLCLKCLSSLSSHNVYSLTMQIVLMLEEHSGTLKAKCPLITTV